MRLGTHAYPLSFALPSTLPPTAHYPHSSTTYKLKARVHRPGAFTPKVKTSREVILVSCPLELEADEGEAGPEDGSGPGLGPGNPGGGASGAPPTFGAGETTEGLSGETGGSGAINVEREWDNTLRYRVEFGRKKIEMGGWMDLRIMLMPLEKVRIWRIGVYLEGMRLSLPGYFRNC
jgi:arrestin-related trafficking adapter 3/6